MCNEIKFPILEKFESYEFNKVEEVLASEPITLQDKPWTAEFKLNDLSAEYVLSFILTNDVKDIKGTKNSTVIFRNGVTATAAKKLPNKKLSWFYHGKPLNNGDMLLNITITKKQFLFSYQDESTNGEWIIHGDTPLTRFDKKSRWRFIKSKLLLGDIRKEQEQKIGRKILFRADIYQCWVHSQGQ